MLLQVRKSFGIDYLLAVLFPASIVAFHSVYIVDVACLVLSLLDLCSMITLIPTMAATLVVGVMSQEVQKLGHKTPTKYEIVQQIRLLYRHFGFDGVLCRSMSFFLAAFAVTFVYLIRNRARSVGARMMNWKLEAILLLINPSTITARHCESRLNVLLTDVLKAFTWSAASCLVARLSAPVWIARLYDNYPDLYTTVDVSKIMHALDISTIVLCVLAPTPYLLALHTLSQSMRNAQRSSKTDI